MGRTPLERVRDVRRVVDAAREVQHDRARIASDLARTTGLSAEGVELGFTRHLEVDATDEEIALLVEAAGDARRVHVILSANVFVASLRAVALARAASERVVVRPSRREPHFAEALVRACADPAVTLVDDIDLGALTGGELHVYGRDETIDAVFEQVGPGVLVRGHGAGMGIAVVGRQTALDHAARAIAGDVVAFDQRGCLSPRLVLVEGDVAHGESFAEALDRSLSELGRSVPRGVLSDDERADATRWLDAMTFAGRTWRRPHHALAVAPIRARPPLPPTGRHVGILVGSDVAEIATYTGLLSRWIVAWGTDEPSRLGEIAPAHARISPLGAMQRPPLDGPVDRRGGIRLRGGG